MNRLKGLVASLLLLALIIGLPAVLLALGVPSVITRGGNPLELLLRPDDGQSLLALLWVAAWPAWLVLTVGVLVELAAAVGRVRVPRLGVLHLPQAFAHQLVSTAALLFVATTSVTPPPAEAAPVTVASANLDHQPAHAVAARPMAVTTATGPAVSEYVVQPGDSLWRIAERRLGAGERYREIVALNERLLGGKPDFLRPGWTLTLPTPEPEAAPGTVTVQRGDTLSKLAARHLGDARRWPEIQQASHAIEQPGGRHLTDPDQIDVGWTLALPASDTTSTQEAAATASLGETPPDTDAVIVPEVGDDLLPAAAPEPPEAASPATGNDEPRMPAEADEGHAHEEPPGPETPTASWVVAGLAGGGLLAGSLALGLASRRALQARYRRPGRTVAPTPSHVIPIEKTIAIRPQVVLDVAELDGILWWTAHQHVTNDQPVPAVRAVEVADTHFVLHLTNPQPAIAPWQATDGDDARWVLDRSQQPQLGPDRPGTPAWPQLVSLGVSDTGTVWLLNLEAAGVLHLAGDPVLCDDYARHLVGELALHPWARDVQVHCLDTCAELADLDPFKVRHHTSSTIVATVHTDADHTTRMLTDTDAPTLAHARASNAGYDLWPSRALIIGSTPHHADVDALATGVLANDTRATGTSLVLTNPDTTTTAGGLELTLTPDGRAALPALGLDLIAVGLTPAEAKGCADLIAAADQLQDAPVPDDEHATGDVRVDVAGRVTDPRLCDRDGAAADDAVCLLPEPDDVYLEETAATTADLATLAPRLPAEVASQLADADPTLDADVAEWKSGHGPRPRLIVLGPLHARSGLGGNATVAVARQPHCTELLAYLWSKPQGATTSQVAEAVGRVTPERVRRDFSMVRKWLGTNPRTGKLHVPDATDSEASRHLGVPAYEVRDLLVDADLFKRLRVRAQARGADGITDLQTALSLVSGEPLSDVRGRGGAWLVDSNLPHHLTCAIVDVAHTVHLAAMAEGDTERARWAADVGNMAAPFEDIPQLDLAAAVAAQGLPAEARRIVEEMLVGDPEEPPLDPSARTRDILSRRGWATR